MAVGRHRQRADFNWALVSKLGIAAAVAMLVLMNHQQLRCAFHHMQGTQLQGLADDSDFTDHIYRPNSDDVARVDAANGFLGNFFGGVGACYARTPLRTSPPWQILTMVGGIALFFVGRSLAKAQFKRNIKRAARTTANPAVARAASTTTSRAVATSGDSAAAGVPRRGATSASMTAASRATRGRAQLNDPLSDFDPIERRGRDSGSDVLAALDDEFDIGAPSRSSGGFDREASSIRRPATSRNAAIAAAAATSAAATAEAEKSRAGTKSAFDEGPPSARAERSAFDDGPPSRIRANATLAFDDDWDDEDDDILLSGSSPVVGNEPSAQIDAGRSAPSATEAFAAVGTGEDDEVVVRLPRALRLGDDLVVAIALRSTSEAPSFDTVVSIAAVSSDARVDDLWTFPRPAQEFEGHDALDTEGRCLLRIPFADMFDALAALAEFEDFDIASLRVAVALGEVEAVETVSVFDTLHIEFADPHGNPIRPSLLRVRDGSRTSRRALVGAQRPGALAIPTIHAARFELEFEDHAALVTSEGGIARRAAIDTEGLAILRGAPPETRELTRRLIAMRPDVIHVAAGGNDAGADGTAELPFGTMQSAINHIRSVRAHADDVTPVELRVQPGTMVPSDRPGLSDGNAASSEWVAWWEGHAANTRAAWTATSDGDALRQLSRPEEGTAVVGDIRIEQLDHVYIVNAAYAVLREQATRDTALIARLDEGYGALPMAVIAGPDDETHAPFRLVVSDCEDVRVEGVHLLGIRGQSGVSVVDCFDVHLIRCWIDHFEAGSTGRSGHYAVGRALQVERSGDENAPVELTWCDIGWNRAVRRSMPVRGAALGAYQSTVRLSRCYIHDNVANADPVDITVDAESAVSGDPTNHRAGARALD